MCMCVCMCMYVYTYMLMCVCVCVCVYTYIPLTQGSNQLCSGYPSHSSDNATSLNTRPPGNSSSVYFLVVYTYQLLLHMIYNSILELFFHQY